MSWFSNLSLRKQLLVSFGAVLALTSGLGAVSVFEMSSMNASTAKITAYWMPSVDAARDIRSAALEFRIAQFRYLADGSPGGATAGLAQIDQARRSLEAARKAYEPTVVTPEDRLLYDRFSTRWDALERHWNELKSQREAGDRDGAQVRMISESRPLFYALDTAVTALVAFNQKGATEAAAAASHTYASARIWVAVFLATCLALGIGVALRLAGRLTRTVARLGELAQNIQRNCLTSTRNAVEAMARGDTSVKARATSKPLLMTEQDELGQLARTFDAMLMDMQALVAAFTATQDKVDGMVTDTLAIARGRQCGRPQPARRCGRVRRRLPDADRRAQCDGGRGRDTRHRNSAGDGRTRAAQPVRADDWHLSGGLCRDPDVGQFRRRATGLCADAGERRDRAGGRSRCRDHEQRSGPGERRQ